MIYLSWISKSINSHNSGVYNYIKRFKSVVTIVEVGPRDGLQYEKVTLPLEVKVQLINKLSETGLNRIESGSFVNPKRVPQLADTDKVFSNITRKSNIRYSALVPNVKSLKKAIESKVDEIAIFGAASEQFCKKNINCSIEESFSRFKEVIVMAKDHSIPIRGYLSCIIGCPYAGKTEPKFVAELASRMIDMGCFEVSLGDTIGIGTPETISMVLAACLPSLPASYIALHCHDTNGHALANIDCALEAGITVIDSSIAGLGGCPFAGPTASGNVATEAVADLLHARGVIDPAIDRARLRQVAHWIRERLGDCGGH